MELEGLNKNKGFTLIEQLVAMAAFGLIVIAISGVATSDIKSQRKAFALQNIQESTRFILESMSKEIRMSVINSPSSNMVNTLNITNEDSETFNYQFDNVNKKLTRGGKDVSPSNVDITGWFYIYKGSYPPRNLVTIIIKAESQGQMVESQAEMELQSTVSSRAF